MNSTLTSGYSELNFDQHAAHVLSYRYQQRAEDITSTITGVGAGVGDEVGAGVLVSTLLGGVGACTCTRISGTTFSGVMFVFQI